MVKQSLQFITVSFYYINKIYIDIHELVSFVNVSLDLYCTYFGKVYKFEWYVRLSVAQSYKNYHYTYSGQDYYTFERCVYV